MLNRIVIALLLFASIGYGQNNLKGPKVLTDTIASRSGTHIIGKDTLIGTATHSVTSDTAFHAPVPIFVDSARASHVADTALHVPASVPQDSTRASHIADTVKNLPPILFSDSSRASFHADTADVALNATDSVRAAHVADTCLFYPPAVPTDSSRAAHIADTVKNIPPVTYSDSARAAAVADTCLNCPVGTGTPDSDYVHITVDSVLFHNGAQITMGDYRGALPIRIGDTLGRGIGNILLGVMSGDSLAGIGNDDNILIGQEQLRRSPLATDNNLIGWKNLETAKVAHENQALGDYALSTAETAYTNIGIGQFAGYQFRKGRENIFLGHHEDGYGGMADDLDSMIFVGTATGATAENLTSSISIGEYSKMAGSYGIGLGAHTHVLHDSSVAIGLNSTTTAKHQVQLGSAIDTAVVHNLRVSGGAGAGKVLTSDAGGVGTWQTPTTGGSVVGYSNDTTNKDLRIGNYLGPNTGHKQLLLGYNLMDLGSSSLGDVYDNNVVGWNSLRYLVDGHDNNTFGYDNATNARKLHFAELMGDFAGNALDSAWDVVAIGQYSLPYTLRGDHMIGIGNHDLTYDNLAEAHKSTFIGYNVGSTATKNSLSNVVGLGADIQIGHDSTVAIGSGVVTDGTHHIELGTTADTVHALGAIKTPLGAGTVKVGGDGILTSVSGYTGTISWCDGADLRRQLTMVFSNGVLNTFTETTLSGYGYNYGYDYGNQF